MLQRIQSVYLLIAAMISIAVYFTPLSERLSEEGSGSTVRLYIDGVHIEGQSEGNSQRQANFIPLILDLLILGAVIYIIFLYRNRQAQIRLCMMTLLICCTYLVVIFYFSDKLPNGEGQGADVKYLTGTYMAALQAFLILLAQRSIRKDEQLVRAADRIR